MIRSLLLFLLAACALAGTACDETPEPAARCLIGTFRSTLPNGRFEEWTFRPDSSYQVIRGPRTTQPIDCSIFLPDADSAAFGNFSLRNGVLVALGSATSTRLDPVLGCVVQSNAHVLTLDFTCDGESLTLDDVQLPIPRPRTYIRR